MPASASRPVLPLPDSLITADCLVELPRWPAALVDHCVTDPPYNLARPRGLASSFSSHVTLSEDWDQRSPGEYLAFTRAWLAEVCRVVRPGGNLLLFASAESLVTLRRCLEERDLRVLGTVVWYKPNAQPNITRRLLTESTEYVLWACNAPSRRASGWTFNYEESKALNGGKQLRNVWGIPGTPARERRHGRHPTQKPLALVSRLLLLFTRPGDLVLDCFAGSGTLGLAARQTGRRYVLVERDPGYATIARARLHALGPERSA